MSIASRITSIEGHIGDIYDSVELTGVDTTDIDKNLVNVPNTLKEGYIDIINNGTDTLYNNFPKVSGEGTSLTLNNTYQAPMRNNLKGNTSQTGTPTPTSPIPVNVVSGDNEITITGRNLLEGVEYGDIIAQTGEETTSTRVIKSKNYIPYYRNTTYYLSVNSVMSTNIGINLRFYNKNKEYIGYAGLTGSGSNFNITIVTSVGDTTPMYFRFRETLSVGPITSLNDNVMITTVNDMNYEPFGNTYNIDLPSGMELCKIGNYQDYFYKDSGKWYLHKEIGKYTFTGNESITLSQTADVFYINNAYTNALINDVNVPLCTIFSGASPKLNASVMGYNTPNNYTALDSGTNKRFYFHTDVYSTTTDLATGLTGQSIYWIYETPTNTEITDTTLINQLEEFYQAQSKNNQTNISQINNDLPFIISASALKKG